MKRIFLVMMFCFSLFAFGETLLADELQNIADEIVKDCKTTTQKIVAVKQFVYKTIKPTYGKGIEPLDKVDSLTRIKKGIGWCHNSVKVFVDLCSRLRIRTRLLWLIKISICFIVVYTYLICLR